MIVFIDESGIQKLDGHSTLAFVYICFENDGRIENDVIAIEQDLRINCFHWSDFGSRAGWRIREKFIVAISRLLFTFKVVLFVNPVHFAAAFEISLEHVLIEKKIRKVIIDGKKSRRYVQRLKKVLRAKGISVKKIRALNDESVPGLRLADAIAGLYRSHADKPTDTTGRLCDVLNKKKTVQLVGGQITR